MRRLEADVAALLHKLRSKTPLAFELEEKIEAFLKATPTLEPAEVAALREAVTLSSAECRSSIVADFKAAKARFADRSVSASRSSWRGEQLLAQVDAVHSMVTARTTVFVADVITAVEELMEEHGRSAVLVAAWETASSKSAHLQEALHAAFAETKASIKKGSDACGAMDACEFTVVGAARKYAEWIIA